MAQNKVDGISLSPILPISIRPFLIYLSLNTQELLGYMLKVLERLATLVFGKLTQFPKGQPALEARAKAVEVKVDSEADADRFK